MSTCTDKYCIPGCKYEYVVEFTYVCTSGPFTGQENKFVKTFEYTCPNKLRYLTIDKLKDGYKLLFTQEMSKQIGRQKLPYKMSETVDVSFRRV